MISHAAALPTQVLMPSIACRMLWTLIHCRRRCEEKVSTTKHHSVTCRMVLCQFRSSSDRLLGVRSPVMVEHHLSAHNGVLFPLRRPLCKRELGFDDLLEQRIFRRFLLCHLVEYFELLFEDRVGRLVELHIVLGLQLDVVLRVAVDGLPLHVLRCGLDSICDDCLQ